MKFFHELQIDFYVKTVKFAATLTRPFATSIFDPPVRPVLPVLARSCPDVGIWPGPGPQASGGVDAESTSGRARGCRLQKGSNRDLLKAGKSKNVGLGGIGVPKSAGGPC